MQIPEMVSYDGMKDNTVFYDRYDNFFNTFNNVPKLLTQLAQHPFVLAIQLTHFLLLWHKMHTVNTNVKCLNLFYTLAQPRPKQCNCTAKFTNVFTLYVRTDNIMF